jgi:hypothetical protein
LRRSTSTKCKRNGKAILKKGSTFKILPIIFVPYVPGIGSGEKSAILQKNTKQSSEKRVIFED